jgi:hypothetical protein
MMDYIILFIGSFLIIIKGRKLYNDFNAYLQRSNMNAMNDANVLPMDDTNNIPMDLTVFKEWVTQPTYLYKRDQATYEFISQFVNLPRVPREYEPFTIPLGNIVELYVQHNTFVKLETYVVYYHYIDWSIVM